MLWVGCVCVLLAKQLLDLVCGKEKQSRLNKPLGCDPPPHRIPSSTDVHHHAVKESGHKTPLFINEQVLMAE